MLNIDTALPTLSTGAGQADAHPPVTEDGIFSQALDVELQRLAAPVEGQPLEEAAVTAFLEPGLNPSHASTPKTAPKTAPGTKDAERSSDNDSLSAILFLGWIEPLRQDLPGGSSQPLGNEQKRPESPAPDITSAVIPRTASAADSVIADLPDTANPEGVVTADLPDTANPEGIVTAGDERLLAASGVTAFPVRSTVVDPLLGKAWKAQTDEEGDLVVPTADPIELIGDATGKAIERSVNPIASSASRTQRAVPAPAGSLRPPVTAENVPAEYKQLQRGKETSEKIAIPRRPPEPEEGLIAEVIVHRMTAEGAPDPRGTGPAHGSGGSEAIPSPLLADTAGVAQSETWAHLEKSSVISQLVEQARMFHWEKNSELVISLKPGALGQLSLRASIVDHVLVATIVADSEDVRKLIEMEMPVLHRALRENGMPSQVVVVQGNELNLGSTSADGQAASHQDSTFQHPNRAQNPWLPTSDDGNNLVPNELPEVADYRYRSRSIHVIA